MLPLSNLNSGAAESGDSSKETVIAGIVRGLFGEESGAQSGTQTRKVSRSLPRMEGGWLSPDGLVFEPTYVSSHWDRSPSGHSNAALIWVTEHHPEMLPDGKSNRALAEIARSIMFKLGFARIAAADSELEIEGVATRAQIEAVLRRGIEDEVRVVHTLKSAKSVLYDPAVRPS
jgi:hypothetical protein